MVYRLARTFTNPAASQSGFAPAGAGAQYNVSAPVTFPQPAIPETPVRPTKGLRSWLFPSSAKGRQRGFPTPENALQQRPPASMPNRPPVFGGVYMHYTPDYDRGAAAFVPNFGKVTSNPIGNGIVVRHRPQASYGPAAQYANGAIWWTSQVIPTSINLQGLTNPQELADIVGSLNVQAMVRTTG
jgi:hypothetical protein